MLYEKLSTTHLPTGLRKKSLRRQAQTKHGYK